MDIFTKIRTSFTSTNGRKLSKISHAMKNVQSDGEEETTIFKHYSRKNVSRSRTLGGDSLVDLSSYYNTRTPQPIHSNIHLSSVPSQSRFGSGFEATILRNAEEEEGSGLKDDAGPEKPKVTESSHISNSFDQFVSLTTDDVRQCFERRGRVDLYASSGHISFSGTVRVTGKAVARTCHIRIIAPSDTLSDVCITYSVTGRPLMEFIFNERFVCRTGGTWRSEDMKMHKLVQSPIKLFIRYRQRRAAHLQLSVNFTSTSLKMYTSPTEGYIKLSSSYGEVTTRYDLTTKLDVPAFHGVMISIQEIRVGYFSSTNLFPLYCNDDRLVISTESHHAETRKRTQEIVLCDIVPKQPARVFRTDALFVRYVSERASLQFNMFFSFFRVPALPEKTPSGQWNCSVAHWPSFRKHIGICNVHDECYGEEDEVNCSHVYQRCGRGGISIHGRCYTFVVQDQMITWYQAADECSRREAYLASLNTPDEWDNVTESIKRIVDTVAYLGLYSDGANIQEPYKAGLRWSDGTSASYFQMYDYYGSYRNRHVSCSYTRLQSGYYLAERYNETSVSVLVKCSTKLTDSFLCETSPPRANAALQQILLPEVSWPRYRDHIKCPAGHIEQKFLACEAQTDCFVRQRDSPQSSCDAPLVPRPPHFSCANALQDVPYIFVCDHRIHCSDRSDENFCIFPTCPSALFRCNNQQCLLSSEHCDGIQQCVDGSDEEACPFIYGPSHLPVIVTPRPPAVFNFDSRGFVEITAINFSDANINSSGNTVCPESHFLCPGKLVYCMPVYMRCNGAVECPGMEDEAGCDSYTCPGFYRCRASRVCVHASHVCDGVFQCPHHDDELLCDFSCPENCTCHGLAFCPRPFRANDFPELRFLDGQGSGISLGDLKNNDMLILLNVAQCGLKYLNKVDLPNLRILDLSGNHLQSIDFGGEHNMNNLQKLSLAGNPLTSLFKASNDLGLRFPILKFLDVSEISLVTLNTTTFSIFPNLMYLNFSGCGIERVVGEGFKSFRHLKSLDLRQCPVNIFPRDLLRGSLALTEVWAENYKLCCPSVLPPMFLLQNCDSPSDEISSCDDLLRSHFYRVFLSVLSSLTLLGNLFSFVYRICKKSGSRDSGFGAFVTHLCISDFLMGVYLAVIGVADRMYLGTYLWNDKVWKRSTACTLAGYLSLLSSEVSAFIICLITLDRFLVLHFPFSRLHFRQKSANAVCCAAWLTGVILAGIPLLPKNSHWEYYSQTGICIPLPITRNNFIGHDYSFSVTIIVNFVLFLLIAMGQASIYWSIKTNSMASGGSTKTSNNLAIAHRLITIVMSDFLCWFPIGVMGLLASNGVRIPGEVNVLVATLLLPVNSAINPFLYTLNILLETKRQAQERRIQKMIMSAAQAGTSNSRAKLLEKCADTHYTEPEAMLLIQTWVSEGLVSENNLIDVIDRHA